MKYICGNEMEYNIQVSMIFKLINHWPLHSMLIDEFIQHKASVECFVERQQHVDAIASQVKEENRNYLKFGTRRKGENVFHQMKRCRASINNSDVLILEELWEGDVIPLLALLMCPKPKKYLFVHNANYWFKPGRSRSLKEAVHKLFRRLFLVQMDGVLILSPNIRRYIQEVCEYKKPVYVLPFYFPEQEKVIERAKAKPVNTGAITFVLPGIIDVCRKDYNMIFNVFEELWSKDKLNVKLKLLGHFERSKENESLIKRYEKMKTKYDNLICEWNEFIGPEEFDKEMNDSDIILTVLNLFFIKGGHKEIYGITKESGNTGLMVKHSLPALVPGYFALMPILESQALRFSNEEDLKKIIKQIMSRDTDWRKLKNSAEENTLKIKSCFDRNMKEFMSGVLDLSPKISSQE